VCFLFKPLVLILGSTTTRFDTTTGTDWIGPLYDAVGNMTKTPQPLSLGNSYDLKYDAWNRLVTATVTGGSLVATYAYDGAYRRITNANGGNTRHYYYSNQWQILEERLNSGVTADRRFLWGLRYIDDLIFRDRGSERFYVCHDYFHPTAIIDPFGAVQERYGYDAFGAARFMTPAFASSTSSYAWETLFGAYRWDSESGLYQVRYRYYHPKLGVWEKRDPVDELAFQLFEHSSGTSNQWLASDVATGIGLASDRNFFAEFIATNLLAYVRNAPISFVDPYGLSFWDTCKDVIFGEAKKRAAKKAKEKAKEFFARLLPGNSIDDAKMSCDAIRSMAPEDMAPGQWETECQTCAAYKCAINAESVVQAETCFKKKLINCGLFIKP
jgi:RHS repeat-associated protein